MTHHVIQSSRQRQCQPCPLMLKHLCATLSTGSFSRRRGPVSRDPEIQIVRGARILFIHPCQFDEPNFTSPISALIVIRASGFRRLSLALSRS